jgi:hypothetical protein
MHPVGEDLTKLTDPQIEAKLYKLNSLYFMTDNPSVRHQMILLMDTYKLELDERRTAAKIKQAAQGNDELDSLIKVR